MYHTIYKQLELLSIQSSATLEDKLQALDQIGRLGTPYDVQYILLHVFSDNQWIAQNTAMVIRKLLTKKEVNTEWLKLYDCFSSGYCRHELTKTNIKQFERFSPEEAVHLYGIATLNYSGYLRELALDYCQKFANFEVLPYVLLRLNDWVPQVQVKAQEVLADILPSISLINLIKCHSLIDWLERTERVKLKAVQAEIFNHIQNNSQREDLLAVMKKASLRERLFCLKALAPLVINDDGLIGLAMIDPAPEVRQWVLRHLPKSEYLTKGLSILLTDKANRVRYAALKTVPYADFALYRQFFDQAIFDNSKLIREYARFMLCSHGHKNHLAQYRQRLYTLKDKANPGLVAGLAETGTKQDIPLLKEYIDHDKSKIRAAALVGLHRLAAENVDQFYCLGLQDTSAKVRAACVSILQTGYSHLRLELEVLLDNGSIKSQKAALKILIQYGALDSLKYILMALSKEHKSLRQIAWQYLASWHHHYSINLWFSFSRETYEQIITLLDQLKKSKIVPPGQVLDAWNDLTYIMKKIKK